MEASAKDYGPVGLGQIAFEADSAKVVKIDTINLQPADQSISGIVVDSNNVPAAGIRIFVNGPRGNRNAGQPSRNAVTDEQGRFFVKRVCKGPLRIQAAFSSDPKGAGFLDAQGGDQDVKVVLGQSGVYRPYVSLENQALPELKDLGIKLSPADVRDRMILLCFFDISQRPSRHCISQLAQRAKTFEDKSVTILAVQASKIEENTLTEWVKKSNFSFPIGRIQGNEEKVRFAWGVKSLPWLILSDRKHIIRAEGFSLTELDAQMKEIEKEE